MNELEKKYEELMYMIGSLVDNGYIKEDVKHELWDAITDLYETANKK